MEDNLEFAGYGFTGTELKWIAIITMLIDHIGASLLDWYAAYMPSGTGKEVLRSLISLVRGIGRLAFPLFIFLMVEGFFYTRSRARYLARLAMFTVISEIPFDLAFYLRRTDIQNHVWLRPQHQNVFFTLAIGFAAMWIIEILRPKKWGMENWRSVAEALLRAVLCVAVAWGACRLANLLHTDYSWKGVSAIVAAYVIRLAGRTDLEIFGMLTFLLFSSRLEMAALADYGLILRYNGQKGKVRSRWFFYCFYPCHLLLLGILRVIFILPK